MLARIRESVAYGDLNFRGHPEQIAVYLIATDDGLVAIDPGPTSCAGSFHETLRLFGATAGDLRHVLLTHIHLDHAGIVGSLVREYPTLRVHVHERGAPHLADPAKLLASARRIYGDQMETLWGAFLPIPGHNLNVLAGGERLSMGTTPIRVAATPGHAVHHVAFLDEREGLAFVGDLAGEGTQHATPVLPATPPPDVDLSAWRSSLDLIGAWGPEALLLTHFGPATRPREHIDELWKRLEAWAEQVRRSLDDPGSDAERTERFVEEEWSRLTSGMRPEHARWVDKETIRASWPGLARYWRTKAAKVAAAQAERPADA